MTSYIYDMVDTWNAGATTFTSIKMNVTDTASAAGSLLMDLQVGGSSRFNVGKTGSLKLGVSPTGTNQAGTNVIIAGSQGTGTGAGGSIIFQVAPAGSSGTAQNALVNALTINSAQQVVMPASPAATTPRYCFDNGTSGLGFINGALRFVINGSLVGTFSTTFLQILDTSAALYLGSDVVFTRDAANTLALRNGANAQAFRVYNTFTSATNFERANIFWDSNVLKIGTEKGSAGGTARALEFQTDGTTRLTIQATSNNVIGAGSFYAQSAAGFFMNNRAGIQSSADGIIRLMNWAQNDFDRLQFGGATSSFPALKRSSASLIVRLADDSADAGLQCAALTVTGNLTISTKDIVTDTTTGTKIGTATTQKIGFFNATPVVQPTAVADATDNATAITQLNALLSRMRDLGLIAT